MSTRPASPTAPAGPKQTASKRTIAYGAHPSQTADLHLPDGTAAVSVVVTIHGGYWRRPYDRQLAAPLALDLVRAGVAVLNIDYRRIEEAAYPATLLDVAAAIDALGSLDPRLDLTRVVALGHSAGGQLAVWAASRDNIRATKGEPSPGAAPRVRLIGAVSQAGVLDLVQAAREGLGGGAVELLLGGGPADVGSRYDLASPVELAPASVPVVAVHGTADAIVPIDQSRRYVNRAGVTARLVTVPDADHFDLITTGTPAWALTRQAVLELLG